MTSHSLPLRTLSPFVESYPWLSSATTHCHDLRTLVKDGHCSSRFLAQLHSFETGALLCRLNMDAAYYCHLLQLSYDSLELSVSQSGVRTRSEYLDLVTLLSAYRLADVIAFMEGSESAPTAPKPALRQTKPGRLLTRYDKLNDWVGLLLDFRAAQKRIKPSRSVPRSQNVHIVLSKWVVHQSHAGRLSAIGINFFGAAMHLSYLLLHRFSENQLPELCSNFNALSNAQTGTQPLSAEELTAIEFTADEVQFWKGIFGEEDNKRERLPLQLALLVSPVCLLMPIQIFKNKYGKENVVQTSIALGNQRPPTLVSVERVLWTVLFDVATGLRHPETALESLAATLPWQDIQACSAQDRAWFQLSTSCDRGASASASTITPSPTTRDKPPYAPLLSQPQPSSNICINHSAAQTALMDVDPPRVPDAIAIAASQNKVNSLLVSAGTVQDIRFQQLGTGYEDLDGDAASNPPKDASPLAYHLLEANGILVDASGQTAVAQHGPICPTVVAPGIGPVTGDPMAVDWPEGDLNSGECGTPNAINDVENVVHAKGGEDERREIGEMGLRWAATVREEAETDVREELNAEVRTVEVEEEMEEERQQREAEKEDNIENEKGEEVEKLTSERVCSLALPSKENAFEAIASLSRSATTAFTPPDCGQNGLSPRRSNRQKPKLATTTSGASRDPNADSKTGDKRKISDALTETKALNPPEKVQRTLSGDRLAKGNGGPKITQAGTREDPIRIDVDAYCLFEVKGGAFQHLDTDLQPLCPQRQSQRVTTKLPLNVWDAHLEQYPLFPRFHHEQELAKFVRIMDSVSDNYVDGLPRHVAEPSTSVFKMIDYSDYEKLKVDDLNNVLRTQCIVVRKMPWPKIAFDRTGLRTLSPTPMDAVISVQDLSLTPSADGSDRIKNGTLRQMLQSSLSGSRAKALNALSFPFPMGDSKKSCFDSNPHATCRVAWSNTSGILFERETSMPVSDVHWGLAATAGAMTWWHLDSDGFGTTVDVHAGNKLWIAGSDKEESFSTLGLLLNEKFDIDLPPKAFRTEAVLLTPGTRLIMRPGIVHAVFTPSNCVCHGSHFYSTPTMQATLVSLIHGFVCHSYITNISHPLTRVFMRRILYFYHRGLVLNAEIDDRAHLPYLQVPPSSHVKIDEALNFLSVCYMVLFINVLDPRTYLAPGQMKDVPLTAQQSIYMDKYDVNAVPLDEREDVCKSRGACLEALAWFRKCFVVSVEGNGASVDLVSIFFFQLSRSLLRYKYAAEVNRIQAAGGCELHRMRRQLESSLALDKETQTLWSAQEENFWMDDELRDTKKVEVLERGGVMDWSSSQEETVKEGPRTNLEEGQMDAGADRCIDLGREDPVPPEPATDGPKWQLDSLQLENKAAYSIVRRDVQYRSVKVDEKRWRKAGTNSLDEAFFAGIDFRKANEAMIARGHVAELRRENN